MLPSGLVRVAADGLIVDANEVLVGWTGAAEVIGRPLASVLVPPGPSVPPDSPEGEYLPALAFVDHLDGSRMPVLVAEGPSEILRRESRIQEAYLGVREQREP